MFTPKTALADDAWWNSAWQKRIKITFSNAARGSLTDFPILVSLNSSRVTYADFLPAGADVRFVDVGGSTVLSHEIEKWDTSGTSVIWAKVPNVAASDADYIYMYYNNPATVSNATTTGVWDSSYSMVQHLSENPAGSAPQFQDSSANNKDGTATSTMASGNSVTGKFGSGLDFNGTSQYVDEGLEGPTTTMPDGSAEFWFDIDSVAVSASNRYLFSRVKSGANDGELRVYVDTTSGSTNIEKITYQIECTLPSANSPIIRSDSVVSAAAGWYHVVATWDDNTSNAMKLYVNGVVQATASTTACGMESTAVNLNIGRNNALNNGFLDGQMDELRVSNVARSADWISASYSSGQDTFNTYGTVESQPDVTSPVISAIASSTSQTTATITWTTDELATSSINYGLTTSYGSASTSLAAATTSHSVVLTGLTGGITYNFQIVSRDTLGNIATSSNLTLTTGAPTAPGQPTGLTALPYENRAYLQWTASSGDVTDYKIEYKLSSDSSWTTFADGVSTGTTTMVTGLTNSSVYNFRVAGLNGVSESTTSSQATTTPSYLMTFTSPMIGNGFSTTSGSVTGYASTTLGSSITPSYFTFRLETSGGTLVSQATTSTRYGNYDISALSTTTNKQNLSITGDLSGVAYVPTTDTLFTIHNNQNVIHEVTRAGVNVRTITCSACNDAEDITLVSSVASTTVGGYDHTFLISTEDVNTLNHQVFQVVIHSTGAATVNRTKYYSTGISSGAVTNSGLEGVAYNSNNGYFFAAAEGQESSAGVPGTPKLYEVVPGNISTNSAASTQICTNINFATLTLNDASLFPASPGYSDISGLYFEPTNNHLYVLSHIADKMFEIDVTSTSSCSVLREKKVYARADSGSNFLFEMPEGITWDGTGDYLYVATEADYWSVWRTTSYGVRNTFSGLSDGTYNMYVSVTDSLGNTSTSTARTFTINTDFTAPTISTVSSSATNGTYKIGDTIDIDIGFSEAVTSTGDVTVTLETGTTDRTCVFTVSNSTTATCDYVVQGGDTSADLTTLSISGTISDQNGNSMSNFAPATNLAASKNLVVDGILPMITGGSIDVSTTTATINWTTDINASSSIAYGLTTSYGTVSTSTGHTTHSVSLSGLSPSTTYHYRILASRLLQNISTTSDAVFTTAALPGSVSTDPVVNTPVPGSRSAVSASTLSSSELQAIFGNKAVVSPQNPTAANNGQNQGGIGNIIGSGAVITSLQSQGKNSPEIKIIQRLLNAFPDLKIASAGVGSPGKETDFFGPATKGAIQKFQLKFGVVKSPREQGYGIVGPKTRLKINELLAKKVL